MASCAIRDCKNARNAKKKRPENLKFHRFPIKNSDLCQTWWKLCDRNDTVNFKNVRICSDHFTSSDYVEDKVNKMLGIPGEKTLDPTAVPSVFPGRKQPEVEVQDLIFHDETKNQETQKLIQAILEEDEQKNKNDYYKLYIEATNQAQYYQQQLTKQQERDAEEKKQMNNIMLRQQKEITRLRLLNKKSKLISKFKSSETQKSKIPQFSAAEQKMINGSKRVNWGIEDIVKNLRIRSISTKAYEMTRNDHNVPRPTVRTLQNWAKKFCTKEGLLMDILMILKEKCKDMDNISRLCVLSFDEMSLNSKSLHDSSLDKIYTNSKAQLVLLRGLYSEWKQPIYYNFDTDITKTLLFEIITEVEKSGLHVCACVSDLGSENRGLWRELDIREGNVQFTNPFDSSRSVFIFSDVPHCIKNLRNHILDHGVVLNDEIVSRRGKTKKENTVIDKSTMLNLVSRNESQFSMINPNLTRESLNVSGPERMRVKPAVQFLSHRTAVLAQQVYPENLSVSEFFDTINDGFDVLNSGVRVHEQNHLKSAYGSDLKSQKEALLKLRKLLASMRVRTNTGNQRSKYLPFQLGLILAIDALFLLYEELQQKYGMAYIFTTRLTQDILESFFALVRSLGGGDNTHPSPPLFRFRLRLIILGSKLKPPRGCNTEVADSDFTYISSELMSKNKMTEIIKVDNPPEIISEDLYQIDQVDNCDDQSEQVEDETLQQFTAYMIPKLRKFQFSSTSVTMVLIDVPQNSDISSSLEGCEQKKDNLVEDIKSCEISFNKLFLRFRDHFNVSSKIVGGIIKINPQLNLKFVTEFVRIRIRMKVKFLNQQKYELKINRRNEKKKAEFVKSSKLKEKKSKPKLKPAKGKNI